MAKLSPCGSLLDQAQERAGDVVADGAADAPVLQLDDVPLHPDHLASLDRDGAEIVDQNGCRDPLELLHQMVEEAGLSGPEEAPDHRDRDWGRFEFHRSRVDQAGEPRNGPQGTSFQILSNGASCRLVTGDGPSDERLRGIAMNRLKALGIQTWVADGWGRGRMLVRPDRFHQYSGITVERAQDFVIYQHAFVAFTPPSPLAHLGGLRFYELDNLEALQQLVEERWAQLVQGTDAALARARGYRQEATLERGSWTINTVFSDGEGRVGFRFDGRISSLYAHSVEQRVLQYRAGEAPISMALPGPPVPVEDAALIGLVRAARARFRGEEMGSESGPLSLDLESNDLGTGSLGTGSLGSGVLAAPGSYSGAVTAPTQSVEPSVDLTFEDDPEGAQSWAPEMVVDQNGAVHRSGDVPAIDLGGAKAGDVSLPPIQPASGPVPDNALAPAQSDRQHPRMSVSIPATVSWQGGRVSVMVADLSAGGVFVQVESTTVPPAGAQVRLGGFGRFGVGAEVAHSRPSTEAELFGTGEGIGLRFLSGTAPVLRPWQEVPACLVWSSDAEVRGAGLKAAEEAGVIPLAVANPLALAVALFVFDVRLLVMAPGLEENVSAALGLEARNVRVLSLPPALVAALDAGTILERLR